MKIRTDFVTNSSSSSYVSVKADNKILAEIFEQYKDKFLKNMDTFELETKNGILRLELEDGGDVAPDMPTSKTEMVNFIIEVINWHMEMENKEFKRNIINDINQRKDEIINTLGDVKLNTSVFTSAEYMPDLDDDEYEEASETGMCTISYEFSYSSKTGKATIIREFDPNGF